MSVLTKTSLKSFISRYLSHKINNDRIEDAAGIKHLRSHFNFNETNIKQFREDVKKLENKKLIISKLSEEIKSPFEILQLTELTEVQKLIQFHFKYEIIEKKGLVAYSASCGSGKTLAGISIIQHFQAKTLIISTRNAVNDQWLNILKSLYPKLKIVSTTFTKMTNYNDMDIVITTPQFLNKNDRILNPCFTPSLIIYDEIHSLLSDSKSAENFNNSLKLPFVLALKKKLNELPFIIGLSATFPAKDENIKLLFNVPYRIKSAIIKIPVSVIDTRKLTSDKGWADSRYQRLSEMETLKYYLNNIPFMKDGKDIKLKKFELTRDPKCPAIEKINLTKDLKGLIASMTIDTSVWCGLLMYKLFNVDILILRAAHEENIYLEHDKWTIDEKLIKTDAECFERLKSMKIGEFNKDYLKFIKNTVIISSTIQRVCEGFSVENIVWGISTTFPWSEIRRVQLVGRVRRCSKNEDVQKAKRILFTTSGVIPAMRFKAGRYLKHPVITYDEDQEQEIFKNENYNYII